MSSSILLNSSLSAYYASKQTKMLVLVFFTIGFLSAFGSPALGLGLAFFHCFALMCAIGLQSIYASTAKDSLAIMAVTFTTWCGFALCYQTFQIDSFSMTKAIGSMYWVFLIATGLATLEVRVQENIRKMESSPSETPTV